MLSLEIDVRAPGAKADPMGQVVLAGIPVNIGPAPSSVPEVGDGVRPVKKADGEDSLLRIMFDVGDTSREPCVEKPLTDDGAVECCDDD